MGHMIGNSCNMYYEVLQSCSFRTILSLEPQLFVLLLLFVVFSSLICLKHVGLSMKTKSAFKFQEDRVVVDKEERELHAKPWNTYHSVDAIPDIVVHPK